MSHIFRMATAMFSVVILSTIDIALVTYRKVMTGELPIALKRRQSHAELPVTVSGNHSFPQSGEGAPAGRSVTDAFWRLLAIMGAGLTAIAARSLVASRRGRKTGSSVFAGSLAGQSVPNSGDFESRHLLAEIADLSFDAIITTTPDGIITSWNPAAERLYGYSPEEAIGSDALMLVPPEYRNELMMTRRRLTQGENVGQYDAVRIDKAGDRHDVVLRVCAIRDQHDALIGTVAITRDLTEEHVRDRYMEDLKGRAAYASRAEVAGKMTSTIVHELGQPLTAIGSFIKSVEHLLQRQDSHVDPKVAELVGRAGQQTRHACEVLVRMREFIANRTTRPEMRNINEVVEEGLQTALVGFPKANVQVVRNYGRQLPKVPIDRTQVHQVVANLAKNAIEAMQSCKRRVLTVSTGIGDGNVRVTVADTGPDMKTGVLRQIFEPYESRKIGGMGIGLPLSRAIVEAHGGRMVFEPNAGGGNQLGFVLPHGSA